MRIGRKYVMVELKGIHKHFGKLHVLRGVDLAIKEGEVVAVIGPSGSGKTTLLRCINLLERAESGTLRIGELKADYAYLHKSEILALRRKTGMVFQSFNLFKNKTVLQNITEGLVTARKWPREKAEGLADALLEKVGLTDKRNAWPHQLSGGQQQRVGIARALALDPEILLFDEPTSALDPELVGEVLSVIRKVAQEGQTMIIVTHEMFFARDVADRVIFIDEGQIVEQGPPLEFFTAPKEERTRQFLKRILVDDYVI